MGDCEDRECGTTCYCGEAADGAWHDGHYSVAMLCTVCEPLIKCPKCGGEESRVYMHLHECPPKRPSARYDPAKHEPLPVGVNVNVCAGCVRGDRLGHTCRDRCCHCGGNLRPGVKQGCPKGEPADPYCEAAL